ncbi:hypothetical protein B0H11DRAFT_1256130 [Mycena galericulata]|nr:hypothetical protein B0H11DRAFT_1256130 [Mycena galericulata]
MNAVLSFPSLQQRIPFLQNICPTPVPACNIYALNRRDIRFSILLPTVSVRAFGASISVHHDIPLGQRLHSALARLGARSLVAITITDTYGRNPRNIRNDLRHWKMIDVALADEHGPLAHLCTFRIKSASPLFVDGLPQFLGRCLSPWHVGSSKSRPSINSGPDTRSS